MTSEAYDLEAAARKGCDDALWTAPSPAPAAQAMSRRLVLLFALACGLSVANIYFAMPLLDAMAREYSIRLAKKL